MITAAARPPGTGRKESYADTAATSRKARRVQGG